MTPAAVAAAMLAAAFVVASCSVEPPSFVSAGARLVVHQTDSGGGRDERLSVFASVSDGDGVEDIEYLYVVHDAEELSWTLSPDDWQRNDDGASVWIGSNGLDAPGPVIPRGEYRLVIVDLAGERAERTFTLSAPATGGYGFPSASIEGTALVLDSPYPTNTAFFIDSGGNVVRTAQILNGSIALDSLWSDGAWRSGSDYIAVYGLEPKAETGFLSWKIRLPD